MDSFSDVVDFERRLRRLLMHRGVAAYHLLRGEASRHLDAGDPETAALLLEAASSAQFELATGIRVDPVFESLLGKIAAAEPRRPIVLDQELIGALPRGALVHIFDQPLSVGGGIANSLQRLMRILSRLGYPQIVIASGESTRRGSASLSLGDTRIAEIDLPGEHLGVLARAHQLARTVEALEPAGVLVHNLMTCTGLAAALAKDVRWGIVHQSDHTFSPGVGHMRLHIDCRREAAAACQASLQELGVTVAHLTLPYLEEEALRETLGRERTSGTTVCTLGRLHKVNGLADWRTIDVLSRVATSINPLQWLVAGGQGAGSPPASLVGALKRSRGFTASYLGVVNPESVLSRADLFVNGFACLGATTSIEAMAKGVPAVGFEDPELPLLSLEGFGLDGESRCSTLEAYPDHIVALLRDERRRRELAERQRDLAQAFTGTAVAESWHSCLADWLRAGSVPAQSYSSPSLADFLRQERGLREAPSRIADTRELLRYLRKERVGYLTGDREILLLLGKLRKLGKGEVARKLSWEWWKESSLPISLSWARGWLSSFRAA